MLSIERIQALLDRLSSYSPVALVVELVVIWIVVYLVVRFVQGTRAAGLLKGVLVIMVVLAILARVVGPTGTFQRLGLLYDRFVGIVALGLVVIFQPELRRALVRLGEAPFFRGTPKDISFIVGEIVDAATYLCKLKYGALIVIERTVGLGGLVEGGTILKADLSARLLQTIFYPGSALHDLAVILKGKTIHAAGVQLPLAAPEEMPSTTLGSRHRAAVGLSKECDAIVVVVSEEAGTVRIAERGRLSSPMTPAELGPELQRRLSRGAAVETAAPAAPEPREADALSEEADATGFDMTHDDTSNREPARAAER